MKPLLTILFILVCMAGKSQNFSDSLSMDHGIIDPRTFSYDEVIRHIDYEITLQDLLNYQDECYRDSCIVRAETIVSNGVAWREDVKEPCKVPTFEGFIEYMKNKYK